MYFKTTILNYVYIFLIGDGPLFPSMLDSSMISRSDTSGESGRGNGSMANLDQSGQDPSTQKYACSRCGRSYLHQVFTIANSLLRANQIIIIISIKGFANRGMVRGQKRAQKVLFDKHPNVIKKCNSVQQLPISRNP
jgi:hypothetical protein